MRINIKTSNLLANSSLQQETSSYKKIQTTVIELSNKCNFEIQKILWKTIYKN